MSFRKLCSGEEFSPELVRAALERGEDVNQRGPNNSSLFMFAATRNKIPLLRLMLEQPSVKVNLAGDDGFTALHLAVYRGNGEALKLLLEHPSILVNLVWYVLALVLPPCTLQPAREEERLRSCCWQTQGWT